MMRNFTDKRPLEKIFIFLTPLLILPLYFLYDNAKTRGREGSVKALAAAIDIGEKSYKNEFKKYSDSLRDIGVEVKLDEIKTYTKVEEIPEADLRKLAKEDYPFFGQDHYQVLFKYGDDGNETFWISDQSGEIRKLERLAE